MNKNFKESQAFQQLYIDYVLSDKGIKKIEHKTTKIAYVYCDNCVYIFNFAGKNVDYIKSLWGNKTKNYLET
jgi:hypothetical protein